MPVFFFQAEDGIRDIGVTGVQTCALPIFEDKSDSDIDGDGIPNNQEISAGSFPYKADSDGDGIGDAEEVQAGSDPTDPRSM